jgi:uncharacterized protein (DUF885 family)
LDTYKKIASSGAAVPATVRLQRILALDERREAAYSEPKVRTENRRTTIWVDRSASVRSRRVKEDEDRLEALHAINPVALPVRERLDWRVLVELATEAVQENRVFADGLWRGDPVYESDVTRLPHESLSDYHHIVGRLRGIPLLVADSIEMLQADIAHGAVWTTQSTRATVEQVERMAPP